VTTELGILEVQALLQKEIDALGLPAQKLISASIAWRFMPFYEHGYQNIKHPFPISPGSLRDRLLSTIRAEKEHPGSQTLYDNLMSMGMDIIKPALEKCANIQEFDRYVPSHPLFKKEKQRQYRDIKAIRFNADKKENFFDLWGQESVIDGYTIEQFELW